MSFGASGHGLPCLGVDSGLELLEIHLVIIPVRQREPVPLSGQRRVHHQQLRPGHGRSVLATVGLGPELLQRALDFAIRGRRAAEQAEKALDDVVAVGVDVLEAEARDAKSVHELVPLAPHRHALFKSVLLLPELDVPFHVGSILWLMPRLCARSEVMDWSGCLTRCNATLKRSSLSCPGPKYWSGFLSFEFPIMSSSEKMWIQLTMPSLSGRPQSSCTFNPSLLRRFCVATSRCGDWR
eukprot:2021539-Rhodomonas_salina.3